MMRVCRQAAIGEVDAAAIEDFAFGCDSDQHRRATVLDDTDGRAALRLSSGHRFLVGARPVVEAP
jgi:hypothetical protein